jgi:uncharacterized protein
MAWFTSSVRTIHIYTSMVVAVLAALVALTGFLLNHSARLGLDEGRTSHASAAVPPELLKEPQAPALIAALGDSVAGAGAADPMEVDDDSVRLVFRAPGRVTDVRIQRETGAAEIDAESRGPAGVILDLHRGKNAGSAWWIIIDISAILLAGAALTGIILGLCLPSRRRLVLICLAAGVVLLAMAYVVAVP